MNVSDYLVPYADFQEFISKYKACFEGEKNRIIEFRDLDKHFKNDYTILNPELIISKDEFIPKIESKKVEEWHFYLNRYKFRNENHLFNLKYSVYEVSNCRTSGHKPRFNIINRIAVVFERTTWKKGIFYDRLIPAKRYIEMGDFMLAGEKLNHVLFKAKRQCNPIQIHYLSDVDWSTRLRLFHGYHLPLNLPTVSIPFIYPEESDYNPRELRVFLEPLRRYNIQSNVTDIIANFEDKGDFVYPQMWYDRELELISKFENTILLSYLNHQEIPMWFRVLEELKKRQINDIELEYLNNTMPIILDLCTKYKNAVNDEVYTLIIWLIGIGKSLGAFSQCQFCDRIIRFRKGKKYCSLTSEGRNCGKMARNSRFYEAHQEKLRGISRREMQLTRELERRLRK